MKKLSLGNVVLAVAAAAAALALLFPPPGLSAPRVGYPVAETGSNEVGGVKTYYGTQDFRSAKVWGVITNATGPGVSVTNGMITVNGITNLAVALTTSNAGVASASASNGLITLSIGTNLPPDESKVGTNHTGNVTVNGGLTLSNALTAGTVGIGAATNFIAVLDNTNLLWVTGTTTQRITLGAYP